MRPDTLVTSSFPQTAYGDVRCPAQVLVIDRRGGPASVLFDAISRLADGDISLMQVDHRLDAVRALDCFCFDLVVVGLDGDRPIQLTLLPEIAALRPETPILVIGRDVPTLVRQYAWHYGADDVWSVPQRAAELRAAVGLLAERYFAATARADA